MYYYISLKCSLFDYIIKYPRIFLKTSSTLFSLFHLVPHSTLKCFSSNVSFIYQNFHNFNKCNQFARITISFKWKRLIEMQTSAFRIMYLESSLKSTAL